MKTQNHIPIKIVKIKINFFVIIQITFSIELKLKFGQALAKPGPRLRWPLRGHRKSSYNIFIIVIMDIQLLMDRRVVIRYIDYQTMNGNGLTLKRFQNNEMISELHR